MEQLQGLLNIQQEDLEVHDWLGNGCSGVVFQGVWRNNGEQLNVAIKKMRISGKEVIDDISRELTMMQNTQSEHICKLYGGCLFNNFEVWLVMEYVDGGDLHHFLHKHGPLSRDTQLSFFVQATRALHTLHIAPSAILHRDIKSLNFLVRNKTKLLLTDFGLSKTKAHIYSSTFTVGTVRWAAPEIVTMSKPQWSEKADIYSLGMVFYEIVTQTLPYQEESNLTSILKKIKTGVLPKLPLDCPKDVAAVILDCLNPKPAKRPSTTELLALLEKIANKSNLGSSGELKIDYDIIRQKCAESVLISRGFSSVNSEQLLGNIPNEFRADSVAANLSTIMWWLINHDDSTDLIITKTFLHSPTDLATPPLIFQKLIELFTMKLEVPQNPSMAFLFSDIRKRIVTFTNLWLEYLFRRDFQDKKTQIENILNLIGALDKTELQYEANILKLTLLRVNKKRLRTAKMDQIMQTYASPKSPRSLIPPPPVFVPNFEQKFTEMNITTVAEQFTAIEFGLFKAIELKEISNGAWKSELPRKNAPNVINLLNRFELVCQWASTLIVMAQTPKQRVILTEKLILLAQKCFELRNYNSLMEIIAGLHRASVQRMKQNWEAVSSTCHTILKGLMEVIEVRNNYKTYREHIQKASLPCLPFFGVFLRDISMEADNPAIEGENINFERIFKMSKIFQDIQMFQQSQYGIEEDHALQLRRLLAMPEEMLFRHSQTIEPTGSPPPPSSPKIRRRTSVSSSTAKLPNFQ